MQSSLYIMKQNQWYTLYITHCTNWQAYRQYYKYGWINVAVIAMLFPFSTRTRHLCWLQLCNLIRLTFSSLLLFYRYIFLSINSDHTDRTILIVLANLPGLRTAWSTHSLWTVIPIMAGCTEAPWRPSICVKSVESILSIVPWLCNLLKKSTG